VTSNARPALRDAPALPKHIVHVLFAKLIRNMLRMIP
jgi:hypothetical protein